MSTWTAAERMVVAREIGALREVCRRLPRPLGFVPTMGALHEGHLALVRSARQECAAVVASIFVNPTQFDSGRDLASYPRDERRDLESLEGEGTAAVFVPAVQEMYPAGFATTVSVEGPLTTGFEGASRSGHFAGVATVVTKLLDIVSPDRAYFGEKDAQQLAVIRRVARDLSMAVHIVGVPTVREADGLALSSRNSRLSAEERRVAPLLHAALQAGRRLAAEAGPGGVESAAVVDAVRKLVSREPRLTVDYVAVVDRDTFAPLARTHKNALIILAAKLGSVRLIDNVDLAGESVPGAPAEAARARTQEEGGVQWTPR